MSSLRALFLVHGHGACSWCMVMVHGHGACSWCMFMVHVHGACSWCMFMVHGHSAWCMGAATPVALTHIGHGS